MPVCVAVLAPVSSCDRCRIRGIAAAANVRERAVFQASRAAGIEPEVCVMRHVASGILSIGLLAASPPAHASGRDIATLGVKPDVPACSSCHGAQGEGQPAAGIPRLAGMDSAYLSNQLSLFENGARKSDVMTPIATALSADQRKAVADYFASLKEPKPAKPSVPVTPEMAQGARLARDGDWPAGIPACSSCHGADGSGIGGAFPRLSGQSAQYIKAQLAAWRDGTRSGDPMDLMSTIARKLDDKQGDAAAQYFAALPNVPDDAADKATVTVASQSSPGSFTPLPDSAIPDDEFGEVVRLGRDIFRDTQHYAGRYVGNSLACQSCHLDRGRMAGSSPLWAAYVSYPAYRAKNGHVNSYAERLQGCFRYSMNGKAPLPDSKTLVALEAYSYFLATGARVGDIKMQGRGYPAPPKPAQAMNYARGEAVYAQHCALCHGADGSGRATHGGKAGFPPLWGPKSFNWGAGMGDIKNAAAFVKANMPFSRAGTLSDQDAWDVAMFVDSHERPQDPRFTGDVQSTRKKYHDEPTSMYGERVNGRVLGEHSPPSGGH